MMINNEKMKNRFSYILICITTAFVLSGSVLAGCSGNAAGSEVLKDKAEAMKDRAEEIKEENAHENDDKASGNTETITEQKKVHKEETKDEEQEKAGAEEEEPEEDVAEEEPASDPVTVYEPVFLEIFEILDYGYNMDREYKYASGGLTEKINYSQDADLLNDIGYHLEDLSGDGIPELLIGSDEDYTDTAPLSYIYGIYTIKDDEPVTVAAGSARSSYNYMGNGQFFYCGSGGVMITIIGENHLSEDGSEIEWDDFYFTDEKENGEVGVYYNGEGLFDTAGSKELDMSEEEFSGIMAGYEDRCENIKWTPIGNYRNGNSGS